jgi:alcohol dehydrogenase class IV
MFEFKLSTRLISGCGSLARLRDVAREFGFRRSLLVTDRGLAATGYADKAAQLLSEAEVEVFRFDQFVEPDSETIEKGRRTVASLDIDSIIGLGGGSSLDCAKGINFVLTNGGRIQDYIGYGKAKHPMLPMIAIPTTAGTGSEVQSYAVVTDAQTHAKMACGDPKAAFKLAILDPELTVSQPREVTAASGFDAITHAVETYVTKRRTRISQMFSREAWKLLDGNYEHVLENPNDLAAREAMQIGACLAGIAIENSMLGATHACANPLSARYGTTHGVALAMLLPSVVRWNGGKCAESYRELLAYTRPELTTGDPAETLAVRLAELAKAGGLNDGLSQLVVPRSDLQVLAEEASKQWTGTFNPRELDQAGALEIYQQAYL